MHVQAVMKDGIVVWSIYSSIDHD